MANLNKLTVPSPESYGTLAHVSVRYTNVAVGVVAMNDGERGLRQGGS